MSLFTSTRRPSARRAADTQGQFREQSVGSIGQAQGTSPFDHGRVGIRFKETRIEHPSRWSDPNMSWTKTPTPLCSFSVQSGKSSSLVRTPRKIISGGRAPHPSLELSNVSTEASLKAQTGGRRPPQDFVPTHHLGSDAFPQFPSSRQTPSTPLFTSRLSAPDRFEEQKRVLVDLLPPCTSEPSKRISTGSFSEVVYRLALLVRVILLQYKFFWLGCIAVVCGFHLLLCAFRYVIILTFAVFAWRYAWTEIKTLCLCRSLSPPPATILTPVQRCQPPRLRDLPQYRPTDLPVVPLIYPAQLPSPHPGVPSPPWLRWVPLGEFGLSVTRTGEALKVALPLTVLQKEREPTMVFPGVFHRDVFSSPETLRMTEKLKCLVTSLLHRLLLSGLQDAALASALSQCGLQYVVEHPLVALYSLEFNDYHVVNLNDRHLPPMLIQLANSNQVRERQLGIELIQLLESRRQLEKYLMIPASGHRQQQARAACLRRLSQWYYGGFDNEFSVYSLALTDPPMTDGDLLHHLLMTFLVQQLPSSQSDIFSRTFLSVPPKQRYPQTSVLGQVPRASLPPVVTIQKLPTEMPSEQGTFYKIMTGASGSMKPTTLEISWDDHVGIFKGISIFLLCLKILRQDIDLTAGPELTRLLNDE